MAAEVDFACLETMTAAMAFAPVALVVLDRKRTLQRANKMAELVLGLNPSQCQGEQFVKWCAEESWVSLDRQFERAAEAKWSLGGGRWNKPQPIAVTLRTRVTGRDPPGKPFSATLSCSSCFVGVASKPREDLHHSMEEAWYIVSIVPSAAASSRTATSSEGSQHSLGVEEDDLEPGVEASEMASVLKDALLDNIGYPLLALSSDGKTSVTNRSADLLLRSIADLGDREEGTGPNTAGTYLEDEVNLNWLFEQFTLCDPDTWIPRHPTQYPMYKVAILGQKLNGDCVGALTKRGSNRKLVSCDGFPMYSESGKFLGGMLLMRDVTHRLGKSVTDKVEKPASTETPEHSLQKSEDLEPGNKTSSAAGEQTTPEPDTIYHSYRACLQHLGIPAFTTTPDGTINWFNDAWYQYSGTSRHDTIESAWDRVHPEDLQACREAWNAGVSTRQRTFEFGNRLLDIHGQHRHIITRMQRVTGPDGAVLMFLGLTSDVHELATVSSAHREARDNLSDALQVADITLWSVDLQGIITLAEGSLAAPSSKADSRRGETSSADDSPIIGRSIYKLWGQDQRTPIEQALLAREVVYEETTIQGRSYRTQYRPRWGKPNVSVSFGAPDTQEQGQILGVTGLSFDITERLRMERKFEESTREIAKAESASQAAEEASRMKSQFLAVVSHEIRTPLNGVIGLSELLLDIESLSEEARGLVQSILRSSGALLTVINDVLDFSKVDAGKLDLTPSPMSLRTVCLDAIWTYRRIWASQGIAFDVDIDQLPEEKVLGDAGRLTQVLNNLFGNAGKFTEEGTISFLAFKIPSSASSSTPRYSFTITDTGCGIPQDQQKMLFQPFRQADPSTSRRFGGSGLGLAICKNLIELMGGTIGLESEENVGTTIHVEIPFPLCPPDADFARLEDAAYTDPAKHPSSAPLPSPDKERPSMTRPQGQPSAKARCECQPISGPSKGHILLAEDNAINAQIAVKTLHKLGYDVSCAENGLEALELLEKESEERPFALALLDIMMPKLDGLQTSRRIRTSENARHRNLPIIAATAAVVGGREICLAAGMTDFLSKPMRRAALDAMLTKWVGKTHEALQDVGVNL
ncbi:hypothetical protein BCV69DRAFT_299880 [Microstroma glucosiphilum]|uniref:histidine kinase n=1 Tax=Pseudomicrostroma glucosiphilum TaxID=1684307 RepID=A0A316U5M6_9BASI|nr:hypothetical protein BCV69DRAFT_299880 [Pseudomicrostroma glucosiphilum]PWN20138.1 hypothetical protein BCV69DRAFT_299880 [Pseudomicrostroma glucosiphilum]